jgi:hypothetical protein
MASGAVPVDASHMSKRIVAAVLWFMAAWLGVGLIGNLLGRPTDIGAVFGAFIAVVVWADPTGALWGPKEPARAPDATPDDRGVTAPAPRPLDTGPFPCRRSRSSGASPRGMMRDAAGSSTRCHGSGADVEHP